MIKSKTLKMHWPIRMPIRFKIFIRPQFIGVVLILALSFSCKKEEENLLPTGIEAQPSENLLGLFTSDTFQLTCTTQRIDSVRTDAATLNTVGSYVDPVLGKVETSMVTQLRLSSENIDLAELRNIRIDSSVLNLVFSGRYGSATDQKFEVYEVTENLSSSTLYYTSNFVAVSNNPIGIRQNSSTVPVSPINEDGELESPSIRISLDTNFARKVINTDQSNYESNSAFTNFMKGIYITSNNPDQPEGEGSILYFNLPDVYTRMVIYYTNIDGSQNELAYLINSKSVSFNLSKMAYSGSNLGNVLEKEDANAEFVYVHSFGGTMVKIETPTLNSIIKNGPVLVNNAKLIFSADTKNDNLYPPISNLFAFGSSTDGNLLYELPDNGEIHYDGAINTSGVYTLGITRYIQGILDGKIENNGLLLRELAGAGARSVIYGPGSSSSAMKLQISYTPISSEIK